MNIETIIKEKKGIVIDVRTPQEYMGGHVVGSINIPLQQIPEKLEEIKNYTTPIILCCASGGRSGNAHQYLSQQGVECYNGGSWLDVNYYHSQNV